VEKILIGLISVMNIEEPGIGAIKESAAVRIKLAQDSLAFNFKEKSLRFEELFSDFFDKIGIDGVTKSMKKSVQEIKEEEDNASEKTAADISTEG